MNTATIVRISRRVVFSRLLAVVLSLIVNSLLLWSINDLFALRSEQAAVAWVRS